VRRRELLAAAAGLTGAAVLSQPGAAGARARNPADLAGGIQDLLCGGGAGQRVPVPALRAATIGARTDFRAARYDRLTATLPRLIATAIATRDGAGGDDRATASSLLADAYIAAANLMIKLNDDPLARARRASATVSGSSPA
jgi:hypothetical protein